ncbi:MAG: hypothetical protein AB4368_15055 [Xenococcaceae cyanobacterium]
MNKNIHLIKRNITNRLRWTGHTADHPMEIILIQRQGKGLSKKAAKPMWLAWIGEEQLALLNSGMIQEKSDRLR